MKEDFNFIKQAKENEYKASKTEPGGIYPRIDCSESKLEILEITNKYLSNSEEQNPERTNQLLAILFDIEIYPLTRELLTEDKKQIGILSALYNEIIKKSNFYIKVILYLIRFSFFVIKIFFLLSPFIFDANFMTVIMSVLAAISIVRKIAINISYQDLHSKLSELLSMMHKIRDEVARGVYSSERISEKLKDLESRGGYVYSIVHSLLEVKHKQKL